MTTENLKALVKMTSEVQPENAWSMVVISGHDEDKRELWEIPKIAELCRRVMASGLGAYLMCSTQCPSLLKEAPFQAGELPGFGSFEVWLIANELYTGGQLVVPPDKVQQFRDDLRKSDIVLQSALAHLN